METEALVKPGTGRMWAFVPAVLLGSLIGFQLWLVRGAFSDPSFSIEESYYAKAVSWDARMAQERENVRLGFRVDLVLPGTGERGVRFTVRDRDGSPIASAGGDVEAFAVARSSRVERAELAPRGPGEYAADVPLYRPGEWEFRVSITRGADRFTTTLRRSVPREAVSR